ncbi:replication termination factor 2-like [Daphnia pulex]|uniref:replication termination factor 2-like n=1 Tax=Daphnia pulex TaxID=6669 RepID=UPI001EDF3BAE|nr:replication termination factor 2-like [Daphnia pulex]
MGCDGGTIPKRDELVRTKKKPEQKDKDAENHCKWRLCASSQEELRSPIVACELGRMFNKQSVLEILLDKEKAPDCGKHLRSLKDIKQLVLTPNPSFKKHANMGDGYDDLQSAEFICPVLGVEMNGKFKFCFIWTCGCVMSERSLKEIKTTSCHKCQKSFTNEDVIVINPSEEEFAVLQANMEARRSAAKAKNKGLKRGVEASEKNSEKGKKLKTGSLNNIAQKLIKLEDPDMAKTKASYSVSKDPHASEVYKSLFTTHDKAVNQTKGHWVTYNPFYN